MRAGADTLHAQSAIGVLRESAGEYIPWAAIAGRRAVVAWLPFTGGADLLVLNP